MTYKRTQTGWITLGVCVGIIILFQLLPATAAPRRIILPTFTLLALSVAVLMGVLTVEVDDDLVRIKFGIGLIRKNFRLDEIASCRPVRNKCRWGWGVRPIPGGWLYNVSGFDAVELEMKNGKVFRIGTDEPKALADFIQARLPRED